MATTHPFLKQPTVLMKLQDQFLDAQSWVKKATVCKYVYNHYKEAYGEDALKAALLMDLVLNIDSENKKKILEIIARNPELILVRTKGDVKYLSSKQKKIAVRIGINNLSPLEAATLSGDFPLVNIFRDALPDNLKHEAGLQVDAILSNSNFLSAFKAVLDAYQKFLKEVDTQHKAKAPDWKTAYELCEHLGDAQKTLSTFGLQVFCNPVPHEPLPDFTLEPVRACRFEVYDYGWKKVDGDLDSFGFGTNSALYKGPRGQLGATRAVALDAAGAFGPRPAWGRDGGAAVVDFEAINLLCKVIPEQLGKTRTLLLQYPKASDKISDHEHSLTSAEALDSDKDKGPARGSLS